VKGAWAPFYMVQHLRFYGCNLPEIFRNIQIGFWYLVSNEPIKETPEKNLFNDIEGELFQIVIPREERS